MCKILFSEYTRIKLGDKNSEHIYEIDYLFLGHYDKRYQNHMFCVYESHWFEFTFRILNKILQNESSPIKITETIKEYGLVCFNQFESNHPIDWLYDLHKKYEK